MITLPDGRTLAADDVGAPDGHPVVYVHGTPDSRLARHPDDGVAAGLGIRLVAVDRPGFGHSSPDPAGTAASFGEDVRRLLARLEVDRCSVLAWSAGTLGAIGVAAALGPRVERLGIAAGIPPHAAFADPEVLDAADDNRRMAVELGDELGPGTTAAELAPYLVPDPPTPELAREQLLTGADTVRLAELASVPGGVDVMVAAMVDSVRGGLDGIRRDLELHLSPIDVDLATVEARALLWYGELDPTAPPAFGRWLAEQLPAATLEVLAGAGHCFPLARWAELLSALRG
jgi:pimeloyl-ACP methyl ester carboxylesterase